AGTRQRQVSAARGRHLAAPGAQPVQPSACRARIAVAAMVGRDAACRRGDRTPGGVEAPLHRRRATTMTQPAQRTLGVLAGLSLVALIAGTLSLAIGPSGFGFGGAGQPGRPLFWG